MGSPSQPSGSATRRGPPEWDRTSRSLPGSSSASGSSPASSVSTSASELTREAARRFFNVDAESVVVAVLASLAAEGKVDAAAPAQAAERYRIAEVVPTAAQDAEATVV